MKSSTVKLDNSLEEMNYVPDKMKTVDLASNLSGN